MPASDDPPEDACEVAEDWTAYVVQAGDNLFAIAYHSDISLVDLRNGNCFDALRSVFAGETILLPAPPKVSLATAVPVFPVDPEDTAPISCEGDGAKILSPQPWQELHGVFTLLASAEDAHESDYLVEVRPAWTESYWEYRPLAPEGPDHLRSLINTEVFGPGLHWLRVTQLNELREPIAASTCDIPTIFVEA